MDYDFIITNYNDYTYSINFETSLSDVVLSGLKLDISNYDITNTTLTNITNQTYEWSIPFKGTDFPNDGSNNVIISAFFMNTNGYTEELSSNIVVFKKESVDFYISDTGIVNYYTTFKTSLTNVTLVGLSLNIPYDISYASISDICGQSYKWQIPFTGSQIQNPNYNIVRISAFFMGNDGYVEELSTDLNIKKLVVDSSGNLTDIDDISLNRQRENYIQLKANINNAIYADSNGYFGFRGAVLDKTNTAYDVSYNLPTGSAQLLIRTITVKDTNETSLGTYDLVLDISATKAGMIETNAYFVGNDYTATVDEDLTSAQVVYWDPNPENAPTVTETTRDVLSATITSTLADTIFSDKLTAIENLYNGSVITSWNMTFLEILPEQFSLLNIINIQSGNTRSLPNFFAEGESITLPMGENLELSVTDFNNNTLEIIPETKVYAVITQDSNAPSL